MLESPWLAPPFFASAGMSIIFDTVYIIIYCVSVLFDIQEAGMSFREKSAWISLVTYLGAYGYYFWSIAGAAVAGQSGAFPVGRLLVTVMGLLVVIEIVLQVAVALWKPSEAQAPRDERDKVIALKSTRWAFYVVMAGAATGAVAVALGAPAFYTANGIFLAVVLAEVVRFAGQVIYFRFGA